MRQVAAKKQTATRHTSTEPGRRLNPKAEIINHTRVKVPESGLRRFAEQVMALIPRTRGAHIDIALVGEKRMRALNAQYRGKNTVTDVLSFRLDDPDDPGPDGPFGAVIICPRYAARAAANLDMTLKQMLEELLLHSILHLTGSTHDTAAEHRNMQRRRNIIMARLKESR